MNSLSKHILIRANYDMIDVNATVHVSKVLQKRRKSPKNIYTGTRKKKNLWFRLKKCRLKQIVDPIFAWLNNEEDICLLKGWLENWHHNNKNVCIFNDRICKNWSGLRDSKSHWKFEPKLNNFVLHTKIAILC